MVVVQALKQRRITNLRSWIGAHYEGNASAAARDYGSEPSLIANLLNDNKSFGEKIARKLESRLGMPTGFLDAQEGHKLAETMVNEMPARYAVAWPFGFDRSRFDRLSNTEKAKVEGAMLAVIHEIEAEKRQPSISTKGGKRGSLQRRAS